MASADVVIAGGGVIGCLTAYYLSKVGVQVTLIEADGLASGASGTSGGWLTPYSNTSDPAMLALSPATLGLHRELAEELPEETGIDHGFEDIIYLRCALTEEGAGDLRSWRAQRAAEGVDMPWLEPDEAKAITRWLTGDIVGAVRSDTEPTLDSYRLTMSAMRAAENHGARVVTGRVTGLVEEAGGSERRATGVQLENGTKISAGHVLAAMGPWTGQAGEWLGVDLPIKPQRGQMVVLAAPDPDAALDIADPRVGISAFDTGGSILRKRLSDTLVAATKEDVGFDLTTTIEARDWLLERAAQLSDRVLDAQISGQTACLRPITPDGKPYVGAAPGWRNAYIAAGHASEGIHFAPVTAAAMSELIVTGQSSHDIGPLSPARLLDT